MKLNETLAKIDAWDVLALLILFFIFMISGYMITKGLISRFWGNILHSQLDLLIMAAFTIHFAIRTRFFLIRRHLARGFKLNIITLLIGLLSFSIIAYFDLFFELT